MLFVPSSLYEINIYISVVIVTGIIQVFLSVSIPVCSVLNVQTHVDHRDLIGFCDPALSVHSLLKFALNLAFSIVNL